MKKLLLLLIIPFLSFGQGWEQTYYPTSSYGYSVQQTTDGGYIITGKINPLGPATQYVFLLKTNSQGEEEWLQDFLSVSSSTEDEGHEVQQTTDGGYIITGTVAPFGNEQVCLIKTDENGNEQWSQIFGGNNYITGQSGMDRGLSGKQTTDGGYIITGYTNSYGNGLTDVWLIKTDENGNEEWSQTFGDSSPNHHSQGVSVQQTTDGGYIIVGKEYFNQQEWDIYLLKTNAQGEEQWSQSFGCTESSCNESGVSVQQTTDGGYIVLGSAGGYYLIKTDWNGNEQWSSQVSDSFSGPQDLQQTTDGGYIITGTNYVDGGYRMYLLKLDSEGEEEWSQTFGISSYGHSVKQTADGGYIICGHQYSNGYNVYLIKTDSEGNVASTNIIEIPTINKTLITTVDILGRETTNKGLQLHIYDDGSLEKRYIIE